jgi:hypothetical protein
MVNKNTDAEDRIKKNNNDSTSIQLGLKPNINQFLLLIVVNAFVGANDWIRTDSHSDIRKRRI